MTWPTHRAILPAVNPKPPQDPRLLAYARRMRCDATDAERKLWTLLRARRFEGHKFRRQVPLGPYILDFYCHAARLAVELDGGQHLDAYTAVRDEGRTQALARSGIRVIRFADDLVLRKPNLVLEEIYRALTGET